ncbi:hypothetical protein VW35_18395 [Devosia soli]|uniref:Pilus assembly protein n=1 Tax=Devosia soli TaxID=361041 RepID=A0A0F5L518_9HYPH|nr:Flp family type IVb pilin [Devosia soli]KKB76717.1 hypothetical protein VW35_18395 [Devosia soli]
MRLDFKRQLRRLCSDERGATAIEYGLIGSLLSVVIIGALLAINGSLTDIYENIRQAIVPVITAAGGGGSS